MVRCRAAALTGHRSQPAVPVQRVQQTAPLRLVAASLACDLSITSGRKDAMALNVAFGRRISVRTQAILDAADEEETATGQPPEEEDQEAKDRAFVLQLQQSLTPRRLA